MHFSGSWSIKKSKGKFITIHDDTHQDMPFISRICMLLFPLYYFPFLFLPTAHFSVAITTTATAYGPLLRTPRYENGTKPRMTPALLVLITLRHDGKCKSPAVFCFWLLSMQDSHTAGARERRNEKKTCFKCFRWVGKGALAVNLLACLLAFFVFLLASTLWSLGEMGLLFCSRVSPAALLNLPDRPNGLVSD